MEHIVQIDNLLLVALAIWELLEIWHHSTLLVRFRARVELWKGWAGSLLNCMFCLAPWAAMVLTTLLAVASELVANQHRYLGFALLLPVYALATARLSNVFNDLMHRYCRTPRHGPEETDNDVLHDIARGLEEEYEASKPEQPS